MSFLTRRTVGVALTLFASASGQWMNSITNAMVDNEKAASVPQLVAEGGGVVTETCGGDDDALKVDKVDVQLDGLALVIRGTLSRPVQGGTIHATLGLIKPKGLSVGQHLKYMGAVAFTRSRKFSEPLCKHLGLPSDGSKGADGCVLQPGAHEMRLSFKGLPKLVFVGKYVLEMHVVDTLGQPVTCARGSLSIQAGNSRGVLRKLESGCPEIIMNNFDDVEWLSVSDVSECAEQGNMVNINVGMKEGVDYTLIGHWHGQCSDDAKGVTVYKRHPEMWKHCSSQEECNFGCENVACQDDGEGTIKCVPTGETSCVQQATYDVTPYEVRESCHMGGTPVSAAAVLRGIAGQLVSMTLCALATLVASTQ